MNSVSEDQGNISENGIRSCGFEFERNRSSCRIVLNGIELIPGAAFNLLEVNFQTDPRPGKVRQANVVLVKK